jgi:hypothetical protein
MWYCNLNNTICIYHLILNSYAPLLIFALIYKYQQMNLFANVNTFSAHYNPAESVLQILCEKPTL